MPGLGTLSLVVPTFERRTRILALLAALDRQTLPPSRFEVVVSIDGSNDGTREAVESLRPSFALQALWQPRRGRAAALNAGIARAAGDLLVLLDDDMEPLPSFLEAHQRAHAGRDRLGVMGAVPAVLNPAAAPAARYIAAKFNGHLVNLARAARPLELTDFYSGNFSIPRHILAEVGGFDEDFDEYGNEDLELSFRLARAGVELVYDAEAGARQHNDKPFTALAADSVSEGRTAVRFALKHPDAYPRLKLGTFRHGPRLLLLLRNSLLRFSPASARLPAWLISLEAALSRINLPGMSTFYRLAFGYLYWLGARAAIQAARHAGRSIGPLSPLARDLHL